MKYELDDVYIRLVQPTDKEEMLKFKQEFIDNGDTINGDGGLSRYDTFEEWVQKLEEYSKEETVPEGKVPATQFLTVRKSDEKIVGVVNVRHRLNDFLNLVGGHIGDAVRPSERKKGYGTKQIALALKYMADLGIDRALITCDENNVASMKTIVKNGGKLQDIIDYEGKKEMRFWVEIKK